MQLKNHNSSLRAELAFAEKYFRLVQQKYGNAYQLSIEGTKCTGQIVPLTLQLLIENAIQHNLGTAENPVCITIVINETIRTSNNLKLKRSSKPTDGGGQSRSCDDAEFGGELLANARHDQHRSCYSMECLGARQNQTEATYAQNKVQVHGCSVLRPNF